MPAPRRGEILFRFAQLLAESKEELAQLMAHEMGKVLPEARGDVQEAVDMAYYMGGEGRRLFGQTTPSELRDKFNMSVRQPIGVVGVITPWNFPIAIPVLEDPARARLREHGRLQACDRHAGARRALRRAAERGGRPGGRRQRRPRRWGQVGHAIVTHPDVPVITLTGSRETGVAGDEGRGRPPEARPPRARRQERDHRPRRRRPRPGRRGHRLVGVRHLGPALHGREPCDRARVGLRPARVQARRRGREAPARRRAGRRTPTSAR